ncbi:MAG: carotene isomerase, partial [Trichodesmium sp. St11_bin5]|nr:carotene isomerase [Trichodesmium sp. St11_bin5]
LSIKEYEAKKEAAAGRVIERLENIFPGLDAGLDYVEVGTARSHQRFLNRADGTYGPIPQRKLKGLLGMPFNRTAIPGLYCVGDSTFPGQGLNAVAFSGFACAHRVAADLGYNSKGKSKVNINFTKVKNNL